MYTKSQNDYTAYHGKTELPLKDIADICRKYKIRHLSAFGSMLTDDFEPETSDADFIADFGRGVTIRTIRYVSNDLAALLGRDVDLFSMDALLGCRFADVKKKKYRNLVRKSIMNKKQYPGYLERMLDYAKDSVMILNDKIGDIEDLKSIKISTV